MVLNKNIKNLNLSNGEFILELENKPNNKIEYKKIETKIDDIEQNAQIKECIVCVESEDKGKI